MRTAGAGIAGAEQRLAAAAGRPLPSAVFNAVMFDLGNARPKNFPTGLETALEGLGGAHVWTPSKTPAEAVMICLIVISGAQVSEL